MNSSFFERCADCLLCCWCGSGHLQIILCSHEAERISAAGMSITGYEILIGAGQCCPFLGDDGCILTGDLRPIHCRLYPLLYVRNGSICIDLSCGFSDEYVIQAGRSGSPAHRHLIEMASELEKLTEKDRARLARWSEKVTDKLVLVPPGDLSIMNCNNAINHRKYPV